MLCGSSISPQLGSGHGDHADHVRCLHSSRCSYSARRNGLLHVKESTREDVKRLGKLVQVTIPTEFKIGGVYNFYCQVIRR